MASVTVTGTGFASVPPDLAGVWKGASQVYHNASTDVVFSLENAYLFEGSGMTAFDTHGFATNGTIDRMAVFGFDSEVDITGLSLAAADVETAFATHSAGALQDLLFSGNDHVTLNPGGCNVDAGAGNDTVDGNRIGDGIVGGTGDDVLNGNGGADEIEGDKGADDLFGGKGSDDFNYFQLSDSTRHTHDTIHDLGNSDFINLGSIDADTSAPDDDAFTIVDAFTGAPGQLTLTYDADHDRTVIAGDVNGDGRADLVISATGNHADFTNFIL